MQLRRRCFSISNDCLKITRSITWNPGSPILVETISNYFLTFNFSSSLSSFSSSPLSNKCAGFIILAQSRPMVSRHSFDGSIINVFAKCSKSLWRSPAGPPTTKPNERDLSVYFGQLGKSYHHALGNHIIISELLPT
jgi:hypothetical protein